MAPQSVYAEARKAQAVHRRIRSEEAKCDLGVAAEHDWSMRHWLKFYRWCLVQHLRGEIFFTEFSLESFAIVGHRLAAPHELLEPILDKIRDGAENLNIINWVIDCTLPWDQIYPILLAIDINSRKLPHPE